MTDSNVPQHYREKLITLIKDTQMSLLVTFPNRGNNILDLCLCTHPDSVLSCETGFSDHDAITLSIQTMRQVIKQHPQTIYLYRSADRDKIIEKLSELSHVYFELNNNSSSQTLEENWSFFTELTKNHRRTHSYQSIKYKKPFTMDVHSIETFNTKKKQRVYVTQFWKISPNVRLKSVELHYSMCHQ